MERIFFSIDAFKKTLLKIMLYAMYASCLWQDNENKNYLQNPKAL